MWSVDTNTANDCPIPSIKPYRVISLDLSAMVRTQQRRASHVPPQHSTQATGRQSLAGTLRPSIGNLTALRAFNIYSNGPQLGGPLPDSMQQLKEITSIYVSNNGFNGSLPAWAPSLKKLEFLYLANNSFSGPIPEVPVTTQPA